MVGCLLSLVHRRGNKCQNVYTTLPIALLLLAINLKHSSSQEYYCIQRTGGFGNDAPRKFMFYVTLQSLCSVISRQKSADGFGQTCITQVACSYSLCSGELLWLRSAHHCILHTSIISHAAIGWIALYLDHRRLHTMLSWMYEWYNI